MVSVMMKYVRKTGWRKGLFWNDWLKWKPQVETPKGAIILSYNYEINILSIFSLKQSDLPAVEL